MSLWLNTNHFFKPSLPYLLVHGTSAIPPSPSRSSSSSSKSLEISYSSSDSRKMTGEYKRGNSSDSSTDKLFDEITNLENKGKDIVGKRGRAEGDDQGDETRNQNEEDCGYDNFDN